MRILYDFCVDVTCECTTGKLIGLYYSKTVEVIIVNLLIKPVHFDFIFYLFYVCVIIVVFYLATCQHASQCILANNYRFIHGSRAVCISHISFSAWQGRRHICISLTCFQNIYVFVNQVSQDFPTFKIVFDPRGIIIRQFYLVETYNVANGKISEFHTGYCFSLRNVKHIHKFPLNIEITCFIYTRNLTVSHTVDKRRLVPAWKM